MILLRTAVAYCLIGVSDRFWWNFDGMESSCIFFSVCSFIYHWKLFSENCRLNDSISRSLILLVHYSPVLLFYNPWKNQKNFMFSDVFRGDRKAAPGCNGLKMLYFLKLVLLDSFLFPKQYGFIFHRIIEK